MRITVADCRRVVGAHYNIPMEVMLSPKRSRRVARPRQMAMVLAREMTEASLITIGAHFCRDHTTVLHAIARIRELEESSPKFAERMGQFRDDLRLRVAPIGPPTEQQWRAANVVSP